MKTFNLLWKENINWYSPYIQRGYPSNCEIKEGYSFEIKSINRERGDCFTIKWFTESEDKIIKDKNLELFQRAENLRKDASELTLLNYSIFWDLVWEKSQILNLYRKYSPFVKIKENCSSDKKYCLKWNIEKYPQLKDVSIYNMHNDNLCMQNYKYLDSSSYPAPLREKTLKESFSYPDLKRCEPWQEPWFYYENCCPAPEYNFLMFKRAIEARNEKLWIINTAHEEYKIVPKWDFKMNLNQSMYENIYRDFKIIPKGQQIPEAQSFSIALILFLIIFTLKYFYKKLSFRKT